MTWEEKLAAFKVLGECALHMRKLGDWYVHQSVEIGGDGMLRSVSGNGRSPESAVEDHWQQLTDLPPGQYVVINAMRDTRRHVRWTGYMWADMPVPAVKATA